MGPERTTPGRGPAAARAPHAYLTAPVYSRPVCSRRRAPGPRRPARRGRSAPPPERKAGGSARHPLPRPPLNPSTERGQPVPGRLRAVSPGGGSSQKHPGASGAAQRQGWGRERTFTSSCQVSVHLPSRRPRSPFTGENMEGEGPGEGHAGRGPGPPRLPPDPERERSTPCPTTSRLWEPGPRPNRLQPQFPHGSQDPPPPWL